MSNINLSEQEKTLANNLVTVIDEKKELLRDFQMIFRGVEGFILGYDWPFKSQLSFGAFQNLDKAELLNMVQVDSIYNIYIQDRMFDAVKSNFSFSIRKDWLQTEINLPFLIQRMADKFNQDDINALCFDLEIIPEDLGDTSAPITKRIERLIKKVEKQNKLGELLRLIEPKLPNKDWLRLFEE